MPTASTTTAPGGPPSRSRTAGSRPSTGPSSGSASSAAAAATCSCSSAPSRWPSLAEAVSEVASILGVREWISLGAIPAAVPHTRPVPILGTSSKPGLLRGDIRPGPAGLLRVPAALISVLEMRATADGIDAVGYFAQVPHYVSGPYAPAALELLQAVERHLGIELGRGDLPEESEQLRTRLDVATAADDNTRQYVERLESMVDEERLPAGDDLITEIEQFLRDQGPQRS